MDRFLRNNLRENSKLEKNMQNVFFFVKLQKQIVQYLIKDSLSENMVKIDAIEDKFRQMVLIILSSNRYFFING